MKNLTKTPKKHLKYETILKKALPALQEMDSNIEGVYYLPSKLIDERVDVGMDLVAIRYKGENVYVDVTKLDNYKFLSKVIGVVDEYNVQAMPAYISAILRDKLDFIMDEILQTQKTLIDKTIIEGANSMSTRLNEVLNAIALPNRSNRNGFYDRSRLDAIDTLLKDSPYVRVANTSHMTMYGRKPVSPGEEPILISTHSDIVSSIRNVSSNLEDGIYHGTYDNLGTNAAAVMLMLEESLPDNVYFAFTDEEETGNCFGARDASTYLEKITGNSPLCIALDVTDEGFENNRLITLEGLSAPNEVKERIANAFLSTEGQLQSCDVVRAKRGDTTFFPNKYMTSSTTVFDESAYYAEQKKNTFSFCLPTEGFMHSDAGIDVKEPVFEGYILSIASFIYAYTHTHSQLIEAYKIAKDNLVSEAVNIRIPQKAPSYHSWSAYMNDETPSFAGYPSDFESGSYEDDEDLTEEEVEEGLYEMAEGYDIVDREIFISDAMELFPDAFSKETLNMIFDNTHFREYDLDDDEDLQGYYNYD